MQIARLIEKRNLTREAAIERLQAQGDQEAKLIEADVVIRNDGTFEMAWRQVAAVWEKKFRATDTAPVQLTPAEPTVVGDLIVERARPRQSSDIAALITRLSAGQRQMSAEDVMAEFGEKAYLLLKADGKPVGLAGWQVENLVARTDDVFLEPGIALSNAMRPLVEVIEQASRDLQCEASLLFLPPQIARHEDVWRTLGYESRTIQGLGVRAWQEAAQDSMPQGTVMLFKQLRKDRVLRPV
jgi:dephospho-CoA kinase